MDHYKRVIVAIKTKGRMPNEMISEALKVYTYKRLPGFARGTMVHGTNVTKTHVLLETIVWLLPTNPGSVSCSFLLKLLRAASLLDCGEMGKKELVKKIGRQLEEASVIDLLIPAPEGKNTLYDVDMVLNIVEEFVMLENGSAQTSPQATEGLPEIRHSGYMSGSAKLAVAKLVDGYIAEIAKDPNLPLSKFIELAEMVSSTSRPVHDGLHHAIDMYLKEHPGLTKSERKKLCDLMDCRKLSVDACMHAVQNERLPLRVVVEVLFSEQIRASAAGGGAVNLPAGTRLLLPRENDRSYESSTSGATTNATTEDDWDAIGDSVKSMKLLGRCGGSERSSGGSSEAHKNGGDG